MRKNKKLLLASVAALGALAIGVGATSTFAWFKVSGQTTISSYSPDTKAVTTKGGSLDLGNFTVTAVPGNPDQQIELTTTAGKTYVFTNDNGATPAVGGGKVEVPLSAGVATISCSLKVTYNSADNEPAKTGAEIKSIWLNTIGNKAIGIKATADGKVRFLETNNTSTLDANDGAKWAGTAGGTGVTVSVSNENLVALSFADCAGDEATSDSTSNALAGNYYVAITGDDTYVETATNYTVTFTPQTAA